HRREATHLHEFGKLGKLVAAKETASLVGIYSVSVTEGDVRRVRCLKMYSLGASLWPLRWRYCRFERKRSPGRALRPSVLSAPSGNRLPKPMSLLGGSRR